jgi:DNA-binding response OmpR family regulator
MQGARILVVDDDPHLRDMLDMALQDAGFHVDSAPDGERGWKAYCAHTPEVCILDVNMPELDGFELCRRIRGAGMVPVLMLTSRDDELDMVVGLEIGADDYMSKPFSTRELVARLRALLRRARSEPVQSAACCEVQGLTVDRQRHEVNYLGQTVELTSTEFDLLFALASQPGLALDRDTMVQAVYGDNIVVASRTIDTFVKRLRHKLKQVNPQFDHIETVRAVGYRYRA